ncbi:hypothetical protein JJB07_06140 [Tumebacillus sp. ITR2]|uniref:Phage late control D family protein n=1 Tax=Tumebacillus amylolyticus TaxID=2801339 RepID=A0ABS1J7H9_9BACL|nr:hypothetical protein [Tumebacillus amylolyticus]MBL0386231.1 hypothetical protein [Tumebacillus amylolyticus]
MIHVQDHGNRRTFSVPRSLVRINGQTVWCNSWMVNLNAVNQADDFNLELPFQVVESLHSDSSYLLNSIETPSELLVQGTLLVEIFVGFQHDPKPYVEPSDLTRIMYGLVDSIEVKFSSSGEAVSLSGRNMVAVFLDNKINEKFPNLTSSQIAEMLAEKHGLKPRVAQTYTTVGTYANDESAEMSNDSQAEWDLLTSLAEQEGFIVCVLDDFLYFGPLENLLHDQLAQDPMAYTWGQNVLELSITRNPHAAKNLTIDVHSYNASQSQHVSASAKRDFPGADSTYQERHFLAGLTQEQAQQRAQALVDQLAEMELVGSVTVTGDTQLRVGTRIALYGVGQVLSDFYYIRKASHTFSQTEGYRTNLSISTRLLGGDS